MPTGSGEPSAEPQVCIWCATVHTKSFQESDRVEAIRKEPVLAITGTGSVRIVRLNGEAE